MLNWRGNMNGYITEPRKSLTWKWMTNYWIRNCKIHRDQPSRQFKQASTQKIWIETSILTLILISKMPPMDYHLMDDLIQPRCSRIRPLQLDHTLALQICSNLVEELKLEICITLNHNLAIQELFQLVLYKIPNWKGMRTWLRDLRNYLKEKKGIYAMLKHW